MSESTHPLDLKALRRNLGLSQTDLAGLLGAHPMTISRWERGRAAPGTHHRRLLEAFARAAQRGLRLERGAAGADPARFLSEVLDAAFRQPELDLGTLSATNRFPGRVVELARGDVMSKVVVEIMPGMRIGSVITTDSVERLGLEVGVQAVAIIKATEVLVGKS